MIILFGQNCLLSESCGAVLFLFRDLANTLDILPHVPPRPDLVPSVPAFGLEANFLVKAEGSESTGEPSCSTDL